MLIHKKNRNEKFSQTVTIYTNSINSLHNLYVAN